MTDYNELKKRLENAIAMYEHAPVYRDHIVLWRDSIAHISHQEQRIAELEAKAARYDWLSPRLLAADFEWGADKVPVLVFKWPADVGVGGNCDKNIDAAIAKSSKDQQDNGTEG